jgi:hypothetical protein
LYIANPPSSANSYSACSSQWGLGFDEPTQIPRNKFFVSTCDTSVASPFAQNYDEWNHWTVTYESTTQTVTMYKVKCKMSCLMRYQEWS